MSAVFPFFIFAEYGVSNAFQNIYRDIAKRYELANHVLTFGLDYYWRWRAAGIAAADGGDSWLDLCSGTGNMLRDLERRAGKNVRFSAADFSIHMLREAQKKSRDCASFVLATVDSLPFPDNSFDLVTVAFATRNLHQNRETLIRRFAEIRRVLKPGGRFVNVESSQPTFPPVRFVFRLHVSLLVKAIGAFVSGKDSGYAYLAKSVLSFYGTEELADLLRESGFSDVGYTRLTFGSVAVHKAIK